MVSGKLQYRPIEGQPLLRNISVNGELTSKVVTAVASGSRVELRNLQGTYQLADGNLELTNFDMESLGGRIVANAAIKHLDASPDSQIRATLRNISLTAIQLALRTGPDRKSTRLNSSHSGESRMPSSA